MSKVFVCYENSFNPFSVKADKVFYLILVSETVGSYLGHIYKS